MENVSLADYIEAIRILPNLVLKEMGIIAEDMEDNNFIKMLQQRRKVYTAKADWLKYYLLDQADILPLLTSTDKVMYKPHAEETFAVFNLAQEVYSRHHEAQEDFESPGQWMFFCEAELCKSSLEATGLIGKPLMKGKADMYRERAKIANHYEAVDKISIVKSSCKDFVSPRSALEILAVVLSQKDIDFKKYWLEYLRKMKQISRTLRGKGYVNCYLGDDGKIVELGIGKGGKTRAKKKKGFCKAM